MCELLGICSNQVTDISHFGEVMADHSYWHDHGWGVAFFPEGEQGCCLIKEPKKMADSELFKLLKRPQVIQSKIIINHIRQKVTGTPSYENTHPFCRELFGEHWALIHNGASGIGEYFRKYLEANDHQICFVPIGKTGSEKALCLLLNELKKRLNVKLRYSSESNSSLLCEYDDQQAIGIIQETCQGMHERGVQLNIIISNGTYMFAYHSGHNSLHYLLREDSDHSMERTCSPNVTFPRQQIGRSERVVIVSTKKITKEDRWNAFKSGQLLVCRNGTVIK